VQPNENVIILNVRVANSYGWLQSGVHEVGHGLRFSFLSLLVPQFSLTTFCYLLLSFSIFLLLFPGLSSCSRPIWVPRFLFSFHLLGICFLCLCLIALCFHVIGPFLLTSHQFLLKTFLHSNIHTQFLVSSVIS